MLLLPSSLLSLSLVFVVQLPYLEMCCVGLWGVRLWCALSPSSQVMDPPPPPGVCSGTWLVGWLAVGFLGCSLGCWLVGSWAAEFG